jgi:hypothetical protein
VVDKLQIFLPPAAAALKIRGKSPGSAEKRGVVVNL